MPTISFKDNPHNFIPAISFKDHPKFIQDSCIIRQKNKYNFHTIFPYRLFTEYSKYFFHRIFLQKYSAIIHIIFSFQTIKVSTVHSILIGGVNSHKIHTSFIHRGLPGLFSYRHRNLKKERIPFSKKEYYLYILQKLQWSIHDLSWKINIITS